MKTLGMARSTSPASRRVSSAGRSTASAVSVLDVVGWDPTAGDHDVVVGLLADGSAVTLVEVRQANITTGVHGGRPRFRVWHVLIGRQYRRMADIVFDSASASFTDLSTWWSWQASFGSRTARGPSAPTP